MEHREEPAEARVDRRDLHGVEAHPQPPDDRLGDDQAHREAGEPAQPRAGTRCAISRRRGRPSGGVIRPALSRWECSANMARFVSHPAGFSEPFERGQSGKAMPAPMLVVKAPSVTRTNTQPAASAENAAERGLVARGPAGGAGRVPWAWERVERG